MKRTMQFVDNYKHKGMRRILINSLLAKGIDNPDILRAFDLVPRHFFLDKAFEELAYRDQPFPIGYGQTISQPYTVAYQTQLLDLKPKDKVLEIGTGSGFQAAIIASMGIKVYTIERYESLYKTASKLLHDLKIFNVKLFHKDGFDGLPMFAPFDKIIITAAAPDIPINLLQQLKIGGLMILPKHVNDNLQQMIVVTKVNEDKIHVAEKEYFSFVPMLKGKV